MSEDSPKTHLYSGAIKLEETTHYRCNDCGLTNFSPCKENRMRAKNKFCDINCMAYVLENGMQAYGNRPRGYKAWLEKYNAD